MSSATRLAKLEAASPASVKPQKIDTWEKFIVCACNYTHTKLSIEQHKQLEPYKQKFEDGTFSIKGEGSDFRAALDILY